LESIANFSIGQIKRFENSAEHEKHRIAAIKRFEDPKERVKVSVATKELWQDPKFIAKQIRARHTFPNKPEKFLDKLFQKLFPDQWKYVGSGDFIVGGTRRNPDFVHITKKLIIEFFGDFWHGEGKTGVPNEQHEQERIDCFAKEGYQTLIIWEYELNDIDKLTQRVVEFNGR